MPPDEPPAVSELLAMWGEGDRDALKTLVPLIYDDLRKVARQQLRKAHPARTLQTTALVHEAYMRFENYHPGQFQNRSHFVAVCALLMRQILTSHERNRRAFKRGGGVENCTLEDNHAVMNGRPIDVLALDDALSSLARLDPEQGRIVELRFFGGLSIEETAEVLRMSPATVKRRWSTARLYLYQQISGEVKA